MLSKRISPYLLLTFSAACPAQTTLAEVFDQLRSPDPKVVESAKSTIVADLEQEFPRIEQDTRTLCSALVDPDPYIRLQATGILSTIARIGPEHASVISACTPNLLVTAMDTVDRVRNNALFALVMNPAGPPPAGSENIFSQAMASQDFRTAELGAVGVLRLGDDARVIHALQSTTDLKQQLNLLYAIGGAQRKSEALFAAVESFGYSEQADLQTAGIDAIVATSPDLAKTISVLNSISNSSRTSSDARAYSQAAIQRLSNHS